MTLVPRPGPEVDAGPDPGPEPGHNRGPDPPLAPDSAAGTDVDPAPWPRTVAWFHCFAGIAGDMALGSLLDAGADLLEVRSLLRRLRLPGWSLDAAPVLRGGLACTRAIVRTAEEQPVSRAHAEIAALVREARLPDRVAGRAIAAFGALATVEGLLHRQDPDRVHFHEVGGHDAVVDVVGTAAALEVLGVDEVAASPVAVGTGTVGSAHGVLPNPAPAVVRLLVGAPTYGRPLPVELTTPTGAALLATLASSFGPLPPLSVTATGFGAGTRELDELPNCTQVVIGAAAPVGAGDGQPVTVLEANLDDATGEQLAHAVAALLDAGAHDAWVSPVVMKKGRPGHTLHALCDPARAERLRQVFRSSTGTFGVRATAGQRWPSAREMAEVTVAGEAVRMKVGAGRAKPEPDDVARVAGHTGLPLHEVVSRAEEAWRRWAGSPGGGA
ncbi:MAG: nickel pincer cofactor biosynthesis protein LarC [Acidimicrobiales bacterium]